MLLAKAPRDALLAPLQAVVGIVERRHTLPILSNVLLESDARSLTLTATDIEVQISTALQGVTLGEPQSVTVGARKFLDILRALPDSAEVSLQLEDKRMLVRAGRSRFNLQTLPASDYPRIKLSEAVSARFAVSQKRFRHLLSRVQYAMAVQDIRYYLNGLLIVTGGTEVRAVATDGHRMAFASEALESDLPHAEVIVPRKTVLELARLLSDSDEPLDVSLAGNQACFRFGAVELITKLIDGKFPDYERVIPQAHPKLLTIERVALTQALARAAILTNEKFRGVRLVLSPGSLKIISTNAEQEEAQDELELAYDGEALDVGFNVGYLLDVLNNVAAERIECRLNDANSSALITLPGDSHFRYVVMPMRI